MAVWSSSSSCTGRSTRSSSPPRRIPSSARPTRARDPSSPGRSRRRASGPSREPWRRGPQSPGCGQRMTREQAPSTAAAPEGTVSLRDTPERWPVVSSAVQARGPIVTLRSDQVQMPDHEVAERQVVEHPGAVAIVALDQAGPGPDDPPVPAPGRPPGSGNCLRACGTSAGNHLRSPRSGNCWRRPGTGPATGRS